MVIEGEKMKILVSIGFYSDFTRLFVELADSLKRNDEFKIVKHYATHPSGYISSFSSNRIEVDFLPIKVRIKSIKRIDLSLDVLDWVGEYSVLTGTNKNTARNISAKYANYFYNEFSKIKPDIVIISGDSRLQSRAACYVAGKLGIKMFFFEQGPFNTTVFDKTGVNKNAAFVKFIPKISKLEYQKITSKFDEILQYSPKKEVRTQFRAMDFLLQRILLMLGFSEVREEKKLTSVIKRQIAKITKTHLLSNKAKIIRTPADILIIGQVPSDANMLLNSKWDNFLQIIKYVEKKFPGKNISFREHPLYEGEYGKSLYKYIHQSEQITLSKVKNLTQDIQRSDIIVVVNSTTGLELILEHGRKVYCLGDAIYGHLDGVYGIDEETSFTIASKYLPLAQKFRATHWFNTNFIQGHFRDRDLSMLCHNIEQKLHEI